MNDGSFQRESPRVGAFFDMDKTLIAENSGSLYMRSRFARGEIGGADLLKGLGAYLQYKLGILDIRNWTLGMLAQFEGERESELAARAEDWFAEMVAPLVYPEARELVVWHRAQGHVVAIVSGAVGFVVEPLARRLGIEHALYTQLEVVGGRFTGRPIEPICFEDGKVHWLQRFVEQQRIQLAKSWFYTDSITDLPLLELVGHPVAVNPDPLLYRKALQRRWPVRLFTPPQPPGGVTRPSASGSSPRSRPSDARPGAAAPPRHP